VDSGLRAGVINSSNFAQKSCFVLLAIKDIRVMETIKEGNTIYKRMQDALQLTSPMWLYTIGQKGK
jgi:hypothetical protein